MNSSRVGGVLFLLLSILYGYFAGDIPLDYFSQQETFNARSLPRIIAVAAGLVSLGLIVMPSPRTNWQFLGQLNWRPALLLLLLMSVYGLVLDPLGFVLATTLFLLAAFFVLGERHWIRMLAVSVPLAGGFWLLMTWLEIYLGTGTLIQQLLALRTGG